VVLGDRYGTSCVAAVVETIEATLAARAIRSAATSPTPAASSPSTTAIRPPGLHAIQLELNRALYMDERRFERSATFGRLAADLEALADCLAAIPLQELRPYRAAAE
jgi:N-formylglutamate deformylase